MITRVWGKCNEYDVIFNYNQTTGQWDATVPMSEYGDYVIELYAKDDAGNVGYYATVLVTIDLSNLHAKVKVLDMSARARQDGFLMKPKVDEYETHIFYD